INVVVYVGPQVHYSCDDVRCLVADFNTHALRACQNILMMKEVERSTGSEELLIARQRSRLGGETVSRDPSLAKAGESGPEVRVGSVQAAIHVSQVIAHVSNLEVAPHPIVLAVARFDEELA